MLSRRFIKDFSACPLNLTSSNKPCYILGYFNINISKPNRSPAATKYLKHLLRCGALTVITKPIRVTDTSATIIDHIITNDTKHPILPGILYSDISDHYPIFCKSNNFCFRGGKSITKLFFKDKSNFKSESFCQDLEHNLYNFSDQFPIPNTENLDEAFN